MTGSDGTGAGWPEYPEPEPEAELLRWVTSVSAGDREGTWETGAVPVDSGGPRVEVTANRVVVNGGTSDVTVAASGPLDSLVLAETGASRGYYEIPVEGDAATLRLTLAQELSADSIDLSFAGRYGDAVGPPVSHEFDVIEVGTGDVQVTLSWDRDSDVDLHVVEPGGEEIYYANDRSASGGELDLDSNPNCIIDGIRTENVTWPAGSAPRGVYTVLVRYYNSCGAQETNYTVRVNNGGDSRTFRGTLTGSRGGRMEITSFERTVGPAPSRLIPPSGPAPRYGGSRLIPPSRRSK